MKNVVIIFEQQEWNSTFSGIKNADYQRGYEHLYARAAEKGIQLYRASYSWFNTETHVFDHAWTFANGQWREATTVHPDVVYDKIPAVEFLSALPIIQSMQQSAIIVNDPDFSILTGNKFYTSLMLPQWMKPMYPVQNTEEFQNALEDIGTENVVVKSALGSGGDDVQILSRREAQKLEIDGMSYIQEYIDTTAGIPGVIDGPHDLRLQFMNDELVYAYVRTPAKGSLIANIAQGGTKHIVRPDSLPDSLAPLIEDVQKRLHIFPHKVYSIDVFFDQSAKPWIVELTPRPGMFFSEEQNDTMVLVHNALIEFFLNL